MMRIALITHFYPAHRGGVEIAAYNIAKSLSESREIEITWCSADCDEAPRNDENFQSIPLKSSNIIEKLLPFPYPLIFPGSILKLFKIIQKSDLVHIHDFLYMSNILAFIFAKVSRKKIIITQHIGFIPYKNPVLRFILTILNKSLGKLMLSKSDATIFISQNVMNYFSNICRNTDNFHFIPNPTDTNIFRVFDETERIIAREKYVLKRFTFLFVGRFTGKKGLPVIKEIAEDFPDCDFIFAGWGVMDPTDWGLCNVQVQSGLTGEKIAELYNVADALILPSYGEGFPLVVQEALACGLDIIVSREIVNASPQITEHTSVIYDEELQIEEFISKIKKNIEEYQYSFENRLGKSVFASNLWNSENNRERYLKVINNTSKSN